MLLVMAGYSSATAAPYPLQDARTNSLAVQAPAGADDLQNALRRLATNSKDVSALIDAGQAALKMGDPVAALGFFARADAIAPRNPLVKAGLGSALLDNENPYEALAMFNRASELGARRETIALDRGLAYDLVGKQDLAQDDYRFLISRNGNNPEALRRFALSLGIIGKREEAESLLTPLLYANDRAAWRVRAFVLAINSDFDGALAITRGSLQPRTARAIEPFFRFMPKLTASQQVAAAHFGHFPQEANIGRDNPRNGEYAALDPSRTQGQILNSRADAGLIPAGEPLGAAAKPATPKPSRKPRRRPGRRISDPAQINAIVGVIEPETPPQATSQTIEEQKLAQNSPGQASLPETFPAQTASTQIASTQVDAPKAAAPEAVTPKTDLALAPATIPATGAGNTQVGVVQSSPDASSPADPAPGFASLRTDTAKAFDLADSAADNVNNAPSAASNTALASAPTRPAAAPAPAPKPTPALKPAPKSIPVAVPAPQSQVEPEEKSFAELMQAIKVPERERTRDVAAVDITKITPARPKPKPLVRSTKPAEPPKPAHPSRFWVQVAGGADSSALKREWRRLVKIAPDAFKGISGWTTPLNKTNRVLAGPFSSSDAAQGFVNTLAKDDISAFTFTSDEGQVIDKLD